MYVLRERECVCVRVRECARVCLPVSLTLPPLCVSVFSLVASQKGDTVKRALSLSLTHPCKGTHARVEGKAKWMRKEEG